MGVVARSMKPNQGKAYRTRTTIKKGKEMAVRGNRIGNMRRFRIRVTPPVE